MQMCMLDYIHTLNKHLQLRLALPAVSEVVGHVSLSTHVSMFPQTSSLFPQLPQIVTCVALQRHMSAERRGGERRAEKPGLCQKNQTVL